MLARIAENPLAFVLGLLGVVSNFVWPLLPGRPWMLAGQMVGGAFFFAHYALMGITTAPWVVVISFGQTLLALLIPGRAWARPVYLASVPVLLGVCLATWQGLPSAFSTAGAVLFSISRLMVDETRMRRWVTVAMPCWFGHNLLVESVPGLVSDIAIMASNSWRLLRRPRPPRTAAAFA